MTTITKLFTNQSELDIVPSGCTRFSEYLYFLIKIKWRTANTIEILEIHMPFTSAVRTGE